MKKQTKIQLLENMILNLETFEGEVNESLLQEMISALQKDRESELTPAPSCLFLYNNKIQRFHFMEESSSKVLNFPAEDILKMSAVEFLNNLIVEEQTIPATYLGSKIRSSFYDRKTIENASINLELNIHPGNKPNEIRRLLVLFRPTHWNEDGKPMLNMGKMYDITHLSKMGPPRLIIIRNNRIIYKEEAECEYLTKENNFGLTVKELELIAMISRGMDNKAIAKKMNSSIATIYTHRKNIKGKTKKSMVSLISELKERGLI